MLHSAHRKNTQKVSPRQAKHAIMPPSPRRQVATATAIKEKEEVPSTQSRLSHPKLFQSDLFINGKFVPPSNNKYIDVIDPGNCTPIGKIAESIGSQDTRAAVDAAAAALPKWAALPTHERCTLVGKLAGLMKTHQKDLAMLIALEAGKPFKEAMGEVAYSHSFFDYYATYGNDMMKGETIKPATPDAPAHIVIEKLPVGVVGAIIPWNFPSAMGARKLAPALVAGCTSVVKPSEMTPYSTLAIAVLAQEAGIPDGVINIVTGDAQSIGHELSTNKKVAKITFTGSTRVGALLLEQSAPQIKNVTMELGGNAPFIVFKDADLELAASAALAAKTRNCGQTCVTPNRFLVHTDIYDEFCEQMVNKFTTVKIGYSLEEGSTMGPMINNSGVEKVQTQVTDAVEKGATILLGGQRVNIVSELGQSDLFFAPTILKNCTTEMKCFKNETFGPLLPVFKFNTIDEAISLANDTDAGLAAYVFTENEDLQRFAGRQLQYGMVAVNQGSVSSAVAPFGGVKTSGLGREGGRVGIEPYYELKTVHYYCKDVAKLKK